MEGIGLHCTLGGTGKATGNGLVGLVKQDKKWESVEGLGDSFDGICMYVSDMNLMIIRS